MTAPAGAVGTIYLLHFDPPYRHASHYLGWTADLPTRLRAHAAGNGARLVAVATAAGSTWRLARVLAGTRRDERVRKGTGKRRMCPICRPELRVPGADLELLAAASALLDQCGARRGGRRSVVRCNELRNGAHGPQHVGRGPAGKRYRWAIAP